MSDSVPLKRELVKRILGNLGAVPGKYLGTAGIVQKDFVSNSTIRIQANDQINEIIIWSAQLTVEPSFKVLLTLLPGAWEFSLVLQSTDKNTIIGLNYLYDDTAPSFSMVWRMDTGWVDMDLVNLMNVTLAIEMITRQGLAWEPCNDPDIELKNLLVESVDLASEIE